MTLTDYIRGIIILIKAAIRSRREVKLENKLAQYADMELEMNRDKESYRKARE